MIIYFMNKEKTAGEILGIKNSAYYIAVVGCGGKTSFITSLSRQFQNRKVLVSPTTKAYPIQDRDIILCDTLEKCMKHIPTEGIQNFGIKNNKTGKLEGLPDKFLEKIVKDYYLALLEADGSAGLDLKGWADYEPVVPDFCTHTVGIVSINAIGKIASKETVHRLEIFTKLTGISEGDIITIETIADMVCKPEGMFGKSAGRKFLFINQAEDEKKEENAKKLCESVKQSEISGTICTAYGSSKNNKWKEF